MKRLHNGTKVLTNDGREGRVVRPHSGKSKLTQQGGEYKDGASESQGTVLPGKNSNIVSDRRPSRKNEESVSGASRAHGL